MRRLHKCVRLFSILPMFNDRVDEVVIGLRLINCSDSQISAIRSSFYSGEGWIKENKNELSFVSNIGMMKKNMQKLKKYPELSEICDGMDLVLDIGKKYNSQVWHFRTSSLDLSKPAIMGVLNVTPDSFSDGGDYFSKQQAINQALKMANTGADIIDIGGESSRPGAAEISIQEEIDRVVPVIESLRVQSGIPISIDTYKSQVAEAAVRAGADIINDISGGKFDPKILDTAKKYKTGLVLMHIKGRPGDMQKNPTYENLIEEILASLGESVDRALAFGIKADRIVIDPGIGFGKRWFDNYDLINQLLELKILGLPILIGVSRKAFLGKVLPSEPKSRFEGSLAANVLAIKNGANIIRVHDVEETKKAVSIADMFLKRSWGANANLLEDIIDAGL